MGCDFRWSGRISDPDRQAEVVGLFRRVFDWTGLWTTVGPCPEENVRTLFGHSVFIDPCRNPSPEDRIEEAYARDYFGVAPYLGRTWDRRLLDQGQMVFDRTDGGRLVSVMPGGPISWMPEGKIRSVSHVVQPGGRVRLLGESQCRAMAMFLCLVRGRYCPDLDIRDDRLFIEEAQKDLEDRIAFDFLPFTYAWRSWAHGLEREADPDWAIFFTAYVPAVLRRVEAAGRGSRRDLPLFHRLRVALTDLWNEDGYAEIIECNGESDGTLVVIHMANGANRVTAIPMDRLEAALS